MKIPFVSFEATNRKIRPEVLPAFEQFFDDAWYILGERLKKFEKEGKLLDVSESAIVVEEIITRLTGKNKDKVVGQGKGKKMPTRMNRSDGETVQHTIPFDNIKTTKIQIKF